MKTTAIILGTVLLLLVGLSVPPQGCGPEASPHQRAMGEAKNVALAAYQYAGEHQGRLPEKLQQLLTYLPREESFERTHLTMPGAVLKDLPPKSILLVRSTTKRKESRLVFVRADGSVDLERPERDRAQRESAICSMMKSGGRSNPGSH